MQIFRQGDVLLIQVTKPSSGAKARRVARIVLAEGEVTGHAHVAQGDVKLLHDPQLERTFLRVLTEGQVVHEEHDTIVLPAGTFEVRRQREYSPEAIRQVAD